MRRSVFATFGQPVLIDLSGALKGKQRIAHYVRQRVEIGIRKTSLTFQGNAGALVGRA
jgi:hypothetical protein